jgi:hypothetical protein
VNRLEVEPAGCARREIEQHVLGHGIAMGESLRMALGKRNHRSLDRRPPERRLELRIVQ